jgi:hypothetical protein
VGRSNSLKVGYGLEIRNYEEWLFKEARDSYDYRAPWDPRSEGYADSNDEDYDADAEVEPSGQICRFLLRRLRRSLRVTDFTGLYAWELETLLKEKTGGLEVQSFGWEYGSLFLGFVGSDTHYDWGAMTVTPEMLEVTPEQRRWVKWAVRSLKATPLDDPGVKILASYG